ncbi:MAG: SGNH/GDSL hydrolase family protein [Isosphaerales bacterium]
MTRHSLATIVILACGLVPDRLSGDGPSRLCDILKSNLFNRVDLERIERGYYEQLLDAGRRLNDLADVPGLRIRRRSGSTWSIPVDDAPLVVRVDDLREVVLKRDDATERWGLHWRTNAQGMRDRPYATDKPAGTFRIALVGDSIGAGWGVNVEQRFESILEQVWHDRAKEMSGLTVEIINCAVPGHSPGQRWYHFGQIGWPMDPDLVIYESTDADVGWDERRLRYLLARGLGWDSPIYHRSLVKAGVEPFGSPDDYKRVLRPRHWDILAGVYQTMAADCRARGLPILWVLVPRVGRKNDGADQRALVKSARTAGFSRVVDVTDAYDDMDPSRLAIEPDDFHPNALGHARLAERLDSALRELPELGRLWKPCPEDACRRDPTPRLDGGGDALRGKVETAVPWPPPGGKPR